FTTDPIANPSYLFSAPTSAVFDFAAGREIIGNVRRTGWVNGSAVVFNQPNMQVTTNAGTAPTDVTVTMIPLTESGDPTDNEREVKRKFQFAQTGGTVFTADLRYPYLDGELSTNAEANLVPWVRVIGTPTEWNGKLPSVTRDGTNNFVSVTGISATEFINEWKLADPKYTMNATAYLRGPWNIGTGLMNTTMNSSGLLDQPVGGALNQPFNTTPFNYTGTENVAAGFFAAHPTIVDWVLCELRIATSANLATSGTIVGRKPGFVLNNGTVVDIDGITPIAFDINKQGAGFMVVRHRNHLGVMSNSLPSNTIGTYTNDYRILANSYKPIGAPSDPMVVLPSSANYGLWGGDANKSGVVNGTDVSAIKNAIAASASGYLLTDVNLSNSVNGTDVSLAKGTISVSGTGGTPGRVAPKVVRTNIPDPVSENQ
ncbi:MAG: dockerin type I domain-containing protein, partial [Chitinophagaceae bacterium]